MIVLNNKIVPHSVAGPFQVLMTRSTREFYLGPSSQTTKWQLHGRTDPSPLIAGCLRPNGRRKSLHWSPFRNYGWTVSCDSAPYPAPRSPNSSVACTTDSRCPQEPMTNCWATMTIRTMRPTTYVPWIPEGIFSQDQLLWIRKDIC